MKNITTRLLCALSLAFLIASCKKDEYKIFLESGTPPTLAASTTGPLVLTGANAQNQAVTFNWTNPKYRFTTGVSSQNVTYVLEVDTLGANFKSATKQEVSIANDLSKTFTVKELNAVLSRLNLVENKQHNVQFRLRASLINGAAPLLSNIIDMKITPYLDVAVPVPAAGNLWIVGDATPNGWNNPLQAQHVNTHKFTRVSTTLYELVITLPGGGAYKLLQDNGVWGTQYHMLPGGTWSAGDFEKRDADPAFPGPPSPGTYKITVNFKTGQYTVVKQ